jgi:signal transduction histidine kinase
MMVRQMEHLVRLVDDLLDLSRITRGKVDLRKKSIDLRPLVADAVDTVADGQRHRVDVEMVDEPLLMDGDNVRLFQVVANLVSNALKFAPESGKVRVAVDRRGDEARISVRDTGVGIAEAELARIFEMFHQSSENYRGFLA